MAPKAAEVATNPVPVAPTRKRRNPQVAVAAETDILARSMRASIDADIPSVAKKNPFVQQLT